MLVLFTDTDTDVTPEIAKEYGYHLISMPYSIDGRTVFPYEDFETFEAKPFYDMLRRGVLPKTSGISEEKYKSYFEPFLANGDDILYVHFSRAMSMTFEAMDHAIRELKEKYPERTVYTIDTKGITTLSLNVAREIGEMYKEGKTIQEILEWAKCEVDHFAMYFFAENLNFFKYSGRVSGIAAAMGSLLGVRPIIHINSDGKMVSIGKEKGRTRAMERLVKYIEEIGDDLENHRIIIGNSDATEIIGELEKMIRERFGDKVVIERAMVNPTAGSHCGPDGIGVSFHAVHR